MATRAEPAAAPRVRSGLSRPALRALTAGAALAAVALAVAGVLLATVRGEADAGEVVAVVLVAAWAAGGVTLTGRLTPPGNRLGAITLTGAVAGGASLLAHAVAVHDVASPAGRVATGVRAAGLALLPALALHLLSSPVPGSRRLRRWPALLALGYAGAAAVAVAMWLARPDLPMWPLEVEVAVVALAVAAVYPIHYRRGGGPARRRMQWFIWGMAVSAVGLAGLVVLDAIGVGPPAQREAVVALTLPVPLGLVLGRRRAGRIPRVDAVVPATAAVGALAAVAVGAACLTVLALGRTPQAEGRDVLLLSLPITAVAAVVFRPLHRSAVAVARGVIRGDRPEPESLLRDFSGHLSRSVPLDELLLEMAESLKPALSLVSVEIWTAGGGDVLERSTAVPARERRRIQVAERTRAVAARAGVSGAAWASLWIPELCEGHDPQGDLRVVPVAHSGELLGLIVVARHHGRGPLDEEEVAMLVDLARQVGLALHNLRLDSALQSSLDELRRQAEALRISRARVVAAADRERRRLERDLHDGAQQHLVAIAVKLRLARRLAERDVEQALAVLDELGDDAREAVQELRRLAHGIYPPLLMDRGLGEAITAAAARSATPVAVELDAVGRYDPAVEAAVYFCCLEAMQNAAKHAPGAAVTVRLGPAAGGLRFEVRDDGPGFDAAAVSRGAGFDNMSDRLGAVGGTLTIVSAPGEGTSVAGVVPGA